MLVRSEPVNLCLLQAATSVRLFQDWPADAICVAATGVDNDSNSDLSVYDGTSVQKVLVQVRLPIDANPLPIDPNPLPIYGNLLPIGKSYYSY